MGSWSIKPSSHSTLFSKTLPAFDHRLAKLFSLCQLHVILRESRVCGELYSSGRFIVDGMDIRGMISIRFVDYKLLGTAAAHQPWCTSLACIHSAFRRPESGIVNDSMDWSLL